MDSAIKSADPRDASFSYLVAAEENLVLKLTEQVQFPRIPVPVITPEKTKGEEGEIGVFDAEKYFNMKLDDDNPGSIATNAGSKYVNQKANRGDLHRMRSKSRIGTPSVCSESSWNSQTALLRNSFQSRQKKVNERWLFAGFTCNGSCSDNKSVHIDPNVVHGSHLGKEFRKEHGRVLQHNPMLIEGRKQQSPSRSVRVRSDQFRSPSSGWDKYLASTTVNFGVQSPKFSREERQKTDEEPRKSIEVFGSQRIKKEDVAMNLERKLSVLTWDAIPKANNFPPTPTSSNQMNEDAESDASSDLFEIEHLSVSTQPSFTQQASDGMTSCVTARSQYEPSEASIEWSVVTASAADFSSAVTDYDEKKLAENRRIPSFTSTIRKSRPGGIFSCRSHKAVDVAETAALTKRNDKAKEKDASMVAVSKIQADTKVIEFEFL